VTVRGASLLLSFDTAVDLGTLRAEDEDLVLYDGTSFSCSSTARRPASTRASILDAADLLECNDHLLLSFDGSGTTAGRLR
jgi:hypothetical protein